MKLVLMFVGMAGLIALILPGANAFSNANTAGEVHDFSIRVDGTSGVKLRMLLITKPGSNQAPEREVKLVTVPHNEKFKAASFYVWFDSLDEGGSGEAGDRIEGTYSEDGELQGGGFGVRIKPENKQSIGLGTL